ncbi:xanthine dehydrogenase family protein molybdopterin-binding subunit [Sinisalibacter aestuarii]|uniref:Aldehyde dehydrogenase n=1 Tax=Sinisalibacter aestuarii TaxID=2949426 RepID=A0ABQ5LY61_9RHOB|nr:molybdopterin cofactor-binding domain-containing protein [Sinisalibacter aestuarii]GKY89568.1 aldehyde dehydrogenase [Sinisalibacter aestuarii]
MNEMTFTRRNFLKITTSAAGGLMIGINIPTGARAAADGSAVEVNAWLTIDPDNVVSIVTPQTEMGQGAFTAVPLMVAEELDIPWENVRHVFADANRHVNNNNLYTTTSTGGSTTVSMRHPYIMQAGASARERLRVAAANRWHVPVEKVVAKQGYLTAEHEEQGTVQGTYGEFAADAAAVTLEEEPAIKAYGDWWLLGKDIPRLDVALKTNGTAPYPIDITVEGMVYAAVQACPVPEGKLVSYDFDAIKDMPGVIAAVELVQTKDVPSFTDLRSAVAVVAESWYQAKNALAVMPVVWDEGRGASISFDSMTAEAMSLISSPGMVLLDEDGNIGKGLDTGVNQDAVPGLIEAAANLVEGEVYSRPFEAHATMMPPCAVADVKADRVDVWTFTQDIGRSLNEVADQLGRETTNVFLHQTYLGGGFGGGYNMDVHRQAAAISAEVGRPVKVIRSREEDIAQDSQRPPVWGTYKAALGDDGLPTALVTHFVGEEKMPVFSQRGVANMPYLVPNRRHEYSAVANHIPIGYHRAPGANSNGFIVEQMVDELAQAGGWDPLEWRLKMTEGNEPWQRVLMAMKEKSGWTTDMGDGEGMGCAVVESHGTIAGCVATVGVSRRGQIFIDKLQYFVNSGYVINPLAAREQAESSAIWELSHAMFGGLVLRDGRIVNTNFDSYQMMRMPDTPPEIEVHLEMSEDQWWGGLGEPTGPPTPPAVANAIFYATGTRVRTTPMSQAAL